MRRSTAVKTDVAAVRWYLSRRDFLKTMGIVSAAALLAACTPQTTGIPSITGTNQTRIIPTPGLTDELGDPANTFYQITNYNNFYEFSYDKQAVADLSVNFMSTPWAVEVGGLVHSPKTFGIEELLQFEQKERIYRLRCVEAWSMVIPWVGFELNTLLNAVEPMTSAKYDHFVTLLDKEQMPGQRSPGYPWPYNEGLRLDEAMHRLTILATGLYGQSLPNQNGAPLRLVVPWKYGIKSIKAITKVELVAKQPATLWNTVGPDEYGFYSNVNPNRPHPRWSQASERRIGELSRRPTLMFNGYAEQVAGLYRGMDLAKNF